MSLLHQVSAHLNALIIRFIISIHYYVNWHSHTEKKHNASNTVT